MALRTLAEYEVTAAQVHGHLCAGQVLGLRMAVQGLTLLALDEPLGRDRKRLVCFVEIDRCMTDAIGVVTGCRLGKRALKFRDFGKAAATFCDLEAGRAVRLAARESSKAQAQALYPELPGRDAQLRAYRTMDAADLFDAQWVQVRLNAEDLPGYKAPRAICAQCGEAVSFGREVVEGERTLCRACAGEGYYRVL